MKEGAWINGRTGKFKWIDEHARFIQRETEARELGLPQSVYDQIKDMKWDWNGEGREKILAAVMNAGFIRMRGHGSYWTFEFTMPTQEALWSCLAFLSDMAGPYTQCRFNNLRTGETIEMPFKDFEASMKEDPDKVLRVASVVPHRRMAAFSGGTSMGDYKVASGYPRLMQIMKGLVPAVHTFGIMSVDNPMAQPASAEDNREAQAKFREVLKHSNYGYVMHNGVYGVLEHAFFIMNVRFSDLAQWCAPEQFNQESFIYGQVDHGTHRVVFQMVEGSTVIATREVVLTMKDNEPNYYSEYKGRKFQIPFFDENYDPDKTATNMPLGAPFQGPDVESPENFPHLATIYANSEKTRLDALELRVGWGNWATRGQTLEALRRLK